MTPRGLVVIIRGPMGAGKSTLLQGLSRRSPYRFWALDADAAGAFHPSDPRGDHLEDEWPLEVEILGLHAKIIAGRGLNLITDPGELLPRREVDRFLRIIGRSRRDPRVFLFRLVVTPETAAARKTTVAASYVRASPAGWQPGRFPVRSSSMSTTSHRPRFGRRLSRPLGPGWGNGWVGIG